ncbi:STAS-like domain-containing protein [Clostridium baratii]|uniref:STAS-like domain-containing protein n=1 Tax=Clostridium baratii TaxID=1561 RepID=UPI0022E637BF|nr:STAS-like domain-containing protein [Clostridium baratii]
MKVIKVKDVISSEFAVSPEDGDIIFNIIKSELDSQEKIAIDFQEIDLMTTAFLNNAIGKLYNIYNTQVLNEYIEIKNISSTDIKLLKKVIDRAKIKFTEKDMENVGEGL